MGIIEELIEIWPNEVCDNDLAILPSHDINGHNRIKWTHLLIPSCPNKETIAKFQRAIQKLNKKQKTFTQVARNAKNVPCITEAFSALPNKKILQIYNAAFPTSTQRKIQITTKGLSRKQVLIPLNNNQIYIIIKNTNIYIRFINTQLKTIKSLTRTEYFCPTIEGISILTNYVLAESNFSIINKYIKTIKGANINNRSTPRTL